MRFYLFLETKHFCADLVLPSCEEHSYSNSLSNASCSKMLKTTIITATVGIVAALIGYTYYNKQSSKPTITRKKSEIEVVKEYTGPFKTHPEFVAAKAKVSKHNYITKTGELLASDTFGFCAAGIFPFLVDELGVKRVLFACEERNGKLMYNFIGGKRESMQESPAATAMREFQEETKTKSGKVVYEIDELTGSVAWFSNAKYALFAAPIDKYHHHIEYQDLSDYELTAVNGVRWFSIAELENIIREHSNGNAQELFHPFAFDMISVLHNGMGLGNFN
jgi:8-oxo-dGTP pyrophosphatase MutT (NUDIX family)